MDNFSNNIIDFIKSGEKHDQLLGVEIEHFILDKNNKSVYYTNNTGNAGIYDILEELSCFYDKKIYEQFNNNDYLIGLKRNDCEISIEPGAQFEISISPCKSVDEVSAIYSKFLNEVNSVLAKHNYTINNIGYRPDACALEVPIIPKMRYICMDANFKNVGTMGFCMMRCSAATQISIDYSSEEDCTKKMKIANAISPLIYFLLDNSTIFERRLIGKSGTSPSGINIAKRMPRWLIWNNADSDRCGAIEKVFNNDLCYSNYAESICNLPKIYMPNNIKSQIDKIKHELSMCFYDVRLKNTIEIRPADSMPLEYTLAYIELIKNLFYDKNNLKSLWNIFKNVSYEDYINAGNNLYNNGWDADVYGHNIHDLLSKIISLAKKPDSKHIIKIENLINNKQCLKDLFKYEFIEDIKKFAPISKTCKFTNIQVDSFNKCEDDFKNFVELRKNSKVAYMNKISNTGYFSKVFDICNQVQFEMIVAKTHKILEKICTEYWNNEDYRNLFSWDEFEYKLINFRPNYKTNVPIARYDMFFNDATGQFEFCEFNTGGSAAMSKVTYACEEIEQTIPYKTLIKHLTKQDINISMKDVYAPWVIEFKKIYKEWCANTKYEYKEKFNVAIIDFLDNCQLPDFGPFKKVFEDNGINCKICDIRKLNFDGEVLKDGEGRIIDAIYKRVTLDDLQNYKDDNGVCAMIDAVLSEKICPIDWFSSQIVHDKQLFAIVNMPETLKLMDKSEIDFINIHFPESYLLNKNTAKDDKFIKNKDKYLIKPISSRDSKNVYVGKDMNINDWKKVIEQCSINGNYIIQKFCKMQMSENVHININDVETTLNNGVQQFCNMEGLYCYNSKFSGMYLRQGSHINDSTIFDMTIPVFYEDYKN